MSDALSRRTRANQRLQRQQLKSLKASRPDKPSEELANKENTCDNLKLKNTFSSEESEESISEYEETSEDFIQPFKKKPKKLGLEEGNDFPRPLENRQGSISPIKSFMMKSQRSNSATNLEDMNTNEQWCDKYSPLTSQELCLHPRKLRDVKKLLSDVINRENKQCRLIALTGPSGSSKSTTVKVLANELIKEKQIDSDIKFNSFINESENNDEKWIEYLDTIISTIPQPQQFSEFLQSCKYRIGSSLSVIIIEELPNVFHTETLKNFRQVLSEWVYTSEEVELPPLVLCLTEVELDDTRRDYFNIENNLSLDTLLGREFLNSGKNSGKIEVIKFNPIAKTYAKKFMGSIIKQEQQSLNKLNKKQIDEFSNKIIETGDIRSIISNLQIWSKLQSINKAPNSMDDMFLRENQITLFHAIGKIIFSSSKYQNLQNEELSDYYSIESVIKNYSNNELLTLSILENYQIYNDLNYDIKIASDIVENLSLNDIMNNLDEGKEIGMRGTRSNLRKVGDTKHKTPMIKFPRQFKMMKEFNRTKNEIRNYQRWCNELRENFQTLNLVDGYYLPEIFNSFKYKYKYGRSKYDYNRLGGKFRKIFAQDTIPIEENEEEIGTELDQFQEDIQKRKMMNENSEEEEVLSEEIEDSEDDEFNDSLDGRQFDDLISQTQNKANNEEESDFEILDDPELDLLLSQRNQK